MDRKKRNSKPPVDEPKFAVDRRYSSIRSNFPAVPVKIEEDVIVINGIPVPKSGKRGSASGSRPISTSSSLSGGSGSGSDNSKFKSEVLRLWESFRTFPSDNLLIDYYELSGPSPLSYGPIMTGSITQFKAETPLLFSPSMRSPVPAATIHVKPISTALSKSDWSPEDDGIQVISPSIVSTEKRISSKEDVDDRIDKVLYEKNNSSRKRLPVFEEICSDE
ncbi:hypothetical protein ACJIZ3_015707 [Penstemon smallii]|uniref:Uncharacterized protein n=1 Tax=Penstemon smallii TaxID=265156 RepID=A0ABD3RP17_9LAMI